MIATRRRSTVAALLAAGVLVAVVGATSCSSKYEPLQVGECLPADAGVEGQRAGEPTVVACTDEHRYQVFARDDLEPPDDTWPGQDLLDANAKRLCGLAIPDVTGRQIEDLPSGTKMVYIAPSEDSWNKGDREVECLFRTDDETTETLVPADR